MRFLPPFLINGCLFFGVLLMSASGLRAKPEAKPNLPALLAEITKASKAASGKADALDLVDQVAKWEQLVKVSASLSALITIQIESSESMIADFGKKALANPTKARLYNSLTDDSKQQLEQLKQVRAAIDVSVARLKKEVKRVRDDPDAAELLELKAKQRRILKKVDQLDSVVSPELERALKEAE